MPCEPGFLLPEGMTGHRLGVIFPWRRGRGLPLRMLRGGETSYLVLRMGRGMSEIENSIAVDRLPVIRSRVRFTSCVQARG